MSLKRNSNQKKLKPAVTRAGSTANNANRRVTSLILKDIASGDEKESASESDSEDDEESNPLALKIKQALTHSIASAEGKTGLLNGKSGLRKIFNDRDLDREIEVASVREPEKPYEPEGYEPLDDSDLEKLKLKNAINRPTFIMDSPRAISIVGDDSPQLLPLDLEESKLGEGVLNDKNTTDEVITRANTQAKMQTLLRALTIAPLSKLTVYTMEGAWTNKSYLICWIRSSNAILSYFCTIHKFQFLHLVTSLPSLQI